MIRSFKHKGLAELFERGRSRRVDDNVIAAVLAARVVPRAPVAAVKGLSGQPLTPGRADSADQDEKSCTLARVAGSGAERMAPAHAQGPRGQELRS